MATSKKPRKKYNANAGLKNLSDSYIKLINEDSLSVQLSELREFEKQIYMHQESMMRLARAATIQ